MTAQQLAELVQLIEISVADRNSALAIGTVIYDNSHSKIRGKVLFENPRVGILGGAGSGTTLSWRSAAAQQRLDFAHGQTSGDDLPGQFDGIRGGYQRARMPCGKPSCA